MSKQKIKMKVVIGPLHETLQALFKASLRSLALIHEPPIVHFT